MLAVSAVAVDSIMGDAWYGGSNGGCRSCVVIHVEVRIGHVHGLE